MDGARRTGRLAALPLLFLLPSCGDGTPILFPAGATVEVESATEQTGTVAELVAERPTVRVTDERGNPVPGVTVRFEVREGRGSLTPDSVLTDVQGRARPERWRLGTSVGTNVLVASLGELGEVRFEAEAGPGAPASMTAVSSQTQEGDVGGEVEEPPAVRVRDRYQNPVPGVGVVFLVDEGDGEVRGSPAVTDEGGIATLEGWTLGSEPGTNRVTATLEGLPEVAFEAEGFSTTLSLTVEGVHLNQGSQARDGSIGGVAGRGGLLRVVVSASRPNSVGPSVVVRLYDGGTLLREEVLPAPADSVPVEPILERERHTWNLPLAASEVVPGLTVVAVVDPDSVLGVDDRSGHRYPADGESDALDVREIPPFNLVLFPIEWTEEDLTGNIHDGNVDAFLQDTRRWIASGEVNPVIREPFVTDEDLWTSDGWTTLLSDLQGLRTAEGATDEYYHGIVPGPQGVPFGGIAYVPTSPSSSFRTGLTYDRMPHAVGVLAHELGHNLGRWHAPCGGPSGVDGDYPYPEADIGRLGYDLQTGGVRLPGSFRDYMSYCGPRWTSDYTYGAILEWRRDDPLAQSGTGAMAASRSAAAGAREGLLIWGRITDEGAVLNPAFRLEAAPALPDAPGPYELRGATEDGRDLFRFSFEGTPLGHGGEPGERHFAFFVPLSPSELDAVERIRVTGPRGQRAQVTRTGPVRLRDAPPGDRADPGDRLDETVRLERGPDGRAHLRWDTGRHPTVLVRDRETGRILSIARSGDVRLSSGGVAAGRAEILVSDGVGSRVVEPR